MEKHDVPHRKIVFVCINRRAEGERTCCAAGGGEALRDTLKAMVKERRLQSKIRVSASGCLDRCEAGPNIMVFPDNVWYSGVRLEDLPAILDELATSLEQETAKTATENTENTERRGRRGQAFFNAEDAESAKHRREKPRQQL